jgi:hypothetical protein
MGNPVYVPYNIRTYDSKRESSIIKHTNEVDQQMLEIISLEMSQDLVENLRYSMDDRNF